MKDYKGPLLARRPDYLVCTCMGVMYSDICDAIANGSDTFEKLALLLGVGSGCTSCVSEVELILNEEISKNK